MIIFDIALLSSISSSMQEAGKKRKELYGFLNFNFNLHMFIYKHLFFNSAEAEAAAASTNAESAAVRGLHR
jgi:hypothetical protein